nr:tRNA pseudouridine(65) synthase TruC [Desulfuromonas versatilis]
MVLLYRSLQYNKNPAPLEANLETLDLIYRDEHCVAVNKPAGLLVHRSEIDRREKRFAIQMVRDQIGQRVYPVHRLDKPTSGVLLFALTPQAARSLSEAFGGGRVRKSYLAVVRGVPEAQGVIDHPLSEELDRMSDARARQGKGPKPAVTGFRRLAEVELPFAVGRYPSSRYALLEAYPRQGRKHQIRRHFKHIFHPIIGDTKHGEGRHNRFFRDHFACHRLLLSAVELSFPHPASDCEITLRSPLDRDFLRVLEQLGWQKALPTGWMGQQERGRG